MNCFPVIKPTGITTTFTFEKKKCLSSWLGTGALDIKNSRTQSTNTLNQVDET